MATPSAHMTSEFSNPNLEVLFSQETIQARIKELGAEITRDYAGRNPLLIGVLKGACFFLSDLLRTIDTRLGIEFMAISSYGSSTRTSGEVRIMKDLDVPIEGRHILVVEDIVDTGLTLSYLMANLESRGAASVNWRRYLIRPNGANDRCRSTTSAFRFQTISLSVMGWILLSAIATCHSSPC